MPKQKYKRSLLFCGACFFMILNTTHAHCENMKTWNTMKKFITVTMLEKHKFCFYKFVKINAGVLNGRYKSSNTHRVKDVFNCDVAWGITNSSFSSS